jgi:hypothetical protein
MSRGGRSERARRLVAEIETALTKHQPDLEITQRDPYVTIEGYFALSSTLGVFDHYQVEIVVRDGFPLAEPVVIETGGRIPRTADRHTFSNGSCCTGVWEEWLVRCRNPTFENFLRGPLSDFFLSQWWFEKEGRWPFGERDHNVAGLREAYAEILNVPDKLETIRYCLRLLSKEWPKGHWPCPCGSGKIVRKCHRSEVFELHQRVPTKLAAHMLQRLERQIELSKARAKKSRTNLRSFAKPR